MAFIDAHRDRFGVEPICAVLCGHGVGIAPSAYDAARTRQPSARAVRDALLCGVIARVHAENYSAYGAAKVWDHLNNVEGIGVARCTTERLMRQMGLQGVRRGRQAVRTTIADADACRPADLVKRDFAASAPNRLWLADLTYVRTHSGWVYAAFVIDAYSRMVIGWQASVSLRTGLALDALEMAVFARRRAGKDLAGLTHHSDMGAQLRFSRSSQHFEMEVFDGTAAGMDGDADGAAGDAVAGSSAGSTRSGAGVLGQGRRGSVERGCGCGVRGVGSGGVALVPRAWRDAVDPAQCVVGQVSVVR